MTPSFERIQLTDAAKADIAALAPAVRQAVVAALIEVSRDLAFGVPLDHLSSVGDLRGCRKIYVDEPGDDKPRFRLVYWCAPDERRPRRAVVLAVGPRKDLAAYALAADRYNSERAKLGLPPVETLTSEDWGLDT